jgi:hypothetical protein
LLSAAGKIRSQSSGVFSVLASRIDGEGGACDHRE